MNPRRRRHNRLARKRRHLARVMAGFLHWQLERDFRRACALSAAYERWAAPHAEQILRLIHAIELVPR